MNTLSLNYRTIPPLPNKHEIEILSQPYLRENIIRGCYQGVEQYLDIQFRLMREDMFRYLRESVKEYKSRNFHNRRTMKLENGQAYFNVEIQTAAYSSAVYFSASVNIGQNVDWVKFRYLKPTSLLCLSKDKFETFIFMCVRKRSPTSGNSSRCKIDITLENSSDSNYLDFNKLYDIIETDSFYEGYKHVLQKLKFYNNANFPLSSCLIDFMGCDVLPAYWLKGRTFIEMFANLMLQNSGNEYFIELLKDLPENFDEHQERAVKMALSSTVTLIQGPPGTGKTFLGLQIVKWLVEKASNRMNAPILVICYTNHALDQFLEGVIKFTQKVLRVGGQSKSDTLKPYNLNNVSQANFIQRKTREMLSEDEKKSIEIFNLLNKLGSIKYNNPYFKEVKKLEALTNKISELIQNIDTNTLYCPNAVLEVFPDDCWRKFLGHSASKTKQKCMKQFVTAVETWLGLNMPFTLVRDQSPELLNEVVKELHDHIQSSSSESRYTKATNVYNANMYAKTFFRVVLDSFFKRGFFNRPLNHTDNFCVNQQVTREIDTFLKENVLSKNIVFNLLKRSVVQHLYHRKSWNFSRQYEVSDMLKLNFLDRWNLFLIWVSKAKENLSNRMKSAVDSYEEKIELCDKVKFEFRKTLMKNADVVGLTTTGAAKNWKLLEEVGPRVVFAEEAAEVLEAHVATALTQSTQHLILIGDHKQLRPSPGVYDLGKNYKMDISMFERLLMNGVPSHCLEKQHRMRPCFAQLLVPEIYKNLEHHPSVLEYEDIKGVDKNMYFITHNEFEDDNNDLHTHTNRYEALFIANMCKYLTQQGYTSENITVLALYAGQVKLLRDLMDDKSLDDINVTTVDNFQGEENDIILLSFVRSNKRKNLGFLKIDNRICVALSRARKGLYCIGNFKLFSSHCKFWQKIIAKVEQMDAISAFLPLKCQNHPNKVTHVASERDFKEVIHGGCSAKCDFIFPCGHRCHRLCHFPENCEDSACPVRCRVSQKEIACDQALEILMANRNSKNYVTGSNHQPNLSLPNEVLAPYYVAEKVPTMRQNLGENFLPLYKSSTIRSHILTSSKPLIGKISKKNGENVYLPNYAPNIPKSFEKVLEEENSTCAIL